MMKIRTALIVALGMFLAGAATGTAVRLVSRVIPKQVIVRVPAPDDGTMKVEYPKHPTHRQAQLLTMAYDIAQRDGLKWPQVLQGIILQESNAGTAPGYKVAGWRYGLKPIHRYYGVAQVKLVAAKAVLRRWPAMWTKFHFNTHTDDEVVAKLIEDDDFNLSIAARYCVILQDMGYTSMGAIAAAYNKGPGGAEDDDPSQDAYALAVVSHIANLDSE
jgi:hypothetical protein